MLGAEAGPGEPLSHLGAEGEDWSQWGKDADSEAAETGKIVFWTERNE